MGRRHAHLWIYTGFLLLLIGLQLRAVETFVLSPPTTRILSDWTGPKANTPEGAIRRIALQSDAIARHQIQPPAWLSWATLSVGAVMLAHGVIQKRSGGK